MKRYLAPGAGFEPATNRLTVDCSTAELSGTDGGRIARRSGLRNPLATLFSNVSSRAVAKMRRAGHRRLRVRSHMAIRPADAFHESVMRRKASWRSGYAEDCKSLHPVAISYLALKISLNPVMPGKRPAIILFLSLRGSERRAVQAALPF